MNKIKYKLTAILLMVICIIPLIACSFETSTPPPIQEYQYEIQVIRHSDIGGVVTIYCNSYELKGNGVAIIVQDYYINGEAHEGETLYLKSTPGHIHIKDRQVTG